MDRHRFAYREATSSTSDVPEFRPLLDVEVTFENAATWRTTVLVDTGSPITVFDRGTAEALAVRYHHAGAQYGTIALLGRRLQVQMEHVECSLLQDRSVMWTPRVGFVTDREFVMPFQGVLGNEGFLDRWAVTFNMYYDYFLIQRPDDAPDC